MKLKYAYGIVPGNSGGGQEAVCRDKVGIFDQNGVTVISLSGLAGTTDYSDLSAKPAEDATAEFVAVRFDELYSSRDNRIQKEILKAIKEYLGEKVISRYESNCSFMFIAVKDHRYLAGHLGGGLIAGRNGDGCYIVSGPEAESRDVLRVYKGTLERHFGFILLSDGACRSLYGSDTGSLSPACGTFFEWLQEYDGEAVSEALTDNINKYFLKDTRGDISVVLTVSDQTETGHAAEVFEASVADDTDSEVADEADSDVADQAAEGKQPDVNEEKAFGSKGKPRKIIKYLVLVLIVLAVIYAFALKQFNNAEKDDPVKEEPNPPISYSENSNEPSVTFSVENPEAYDPGVYKAGVDIPAGEYFFWTGEMLKPNSIIVNDDTCLSGELYCMTIQLNEWDTLISDYRFTAAGNVNPVEPTEGILWSGKYKIGKDIEPGAYTASPVNKGMEARYYSLFDEEISNDVKFSEDTTVTVPEEGYIVFYNSVLFVEKE